MDQLRAAGRVYFLFPLTELHIMDVLLGLQIHLKHGVLQRLMPPETMSLVEDILAIAQPIALAIQVGYHLNISLIVKCHSASLYIFNLTVAYTRI